MSRPRRALVYPSPWFLVRLLIPYSVFVAAMLEILVGLLNATPSKQLSLRSLTASVSSNQFFSFAGVIVVIVLTSAIADFLKRPDPQEHRDARRYLAAVNNLPEAAAVVCAVILNIVAVASIWTSLTARTSAPIPVFEYVMIATVGFAVSVFASLRLTSRANDLLMNNRRARRGEREAKANLKAALAQFRASDLGRETWTTTARVARTVAAWLVCLLPSLALDLFLLRAGWGLASAIVFTLCCGVLTLIAGSQLVKFRVTASKFGAIFYFSLVAFAVVILLLVFFVLLAEVSGWTFLQAAGAAFGAIPAIVLVATAIAWECSTRSPRMRLLPLVNSNVRTTLLAQIKRTNRRIRQLKRRAAKLS